VGKVANFEDRTDGLHPLGEFAFQLLKRTFNCEFEIVVSDWVLKEMEKQIANLALFIELLDRLQKLGKLIKIYKNLEIVKEAKTLTKSSDIHFADALHAAIAKESNAVLVTWNIKDFEKVKDFVEVRQPKEL